MPFGVAFELIDPKALPKGISAESPPPAQTQYSTRHINGMQRAHANALVRMLQILRVTCSPILRLLGARVFQPAIY